MIFVKIIKRLLRDFCGKKWRQILFGKRIIELAKICADIEKHYRKPRDIEWAFAKGKFYIVQSRPITTL